MQLLFYKGRASIWDKFICLITASPYSHVEVVDYIDNYNNYVCWSADAWDGVVRNKSISFNPAKWELVKIKDSINTIDWFEQHRNKKYDFLGLLCTITKISLFNTKDKWFCSEIVAEYLGYRDSWKYTPAKLYKELKCSQVS